MELTGPHPLDIPETYALHDPTGMGGRLLSLPKQACEGWELGDQIAGPAYSRPIERVLVAGMGGSAIGGEMIKGLAELQPGGPQIATWRDCGLPGWVDERTLVAAVSVSGETPETRSAFSAAGAAGAERIAIAGPGPLSEDAREAGAALAEITWAGEPRSALGFTFVAPYRALQRIAGLADTSAVFDEAVAELADLAGSMAIEVPVEENVAKQIAIELGDRMPVIYGSGHMTSVAMRWKTQFNENADLLAAWEAIPEAGHNTVQAARSAHRFEGLVYALVLRPGKCPPEIAERIDATLDIFSENHFPNLMLEIAAPNPLGEVLSGALMGDMVSFYSAVLHETDPSETMILDDMKRRLGAHSHGS